LVVFPAKAGILFFLGLLDSRLRGGDDGNGFFNILLIFLSQGIAKGVHAGV
jgi:hypothetical protein